MLNFSRNALNTSFERDQLTKRLRKRKRNLTDSGFFFVLAPFCDVFVLLRASATFSVVFLDHVKTAVILRNERFGERGLCSHPLLM